MLIKVLLLEEYKVEFYGALLFFNFGAIIKLPLGKTGFLKILGSSVPDK